MYPPYPDILRILGLRDCLEAKALPNGRKGKSATHEEIQAYQRKRDTLTTTPRYDYNDKLRQKAGGGVQTPPVLRMAVFWAR